MRLSTVYLPFAAVAALATACTGTAPNPTPPRETALPPQGAAAPAWPAAEQSAMRIVVTEATAVELPFELVEAITGSSALLIAYLPDRCVWRHINRSGTIGPLQTVVGRHVVGLFDGATPLLVTSDGKHLCAGPPDGDRSSDDCVASQAQLASTIAGRPALIEQRVTRADDDEDDGKAAAKKTPPEVGVFVRFIDERGAIDREATDSLLSFGRPLPGMALIDAVGTAKGARLLWYEHTKPKRRGRREEPRAKMRSGRLDAAGKLVDQSSSTLFQGKREYGYIEGHRQPHLYAEGPRAIYVGRFVKKERGKTKFGWEARSIRPKGELSAANSLFEVDPRRLLNDEPVRTNEQEMHDALAKLKPRLAVHQSPSDPGRIVWTDKLGFFLSNGVLHSVPLAEATATPHDHPFAVERSRVFWGTHEVTGHSLARTSAGYVAIAPDGATTAYGEGEAELTRPTERAVEAARVGDAWWVLRPRATGAYQLAPLSNGAVVDATIVEPWLHPDTVELVGGALGLVLAVSGERMTVHRLVDGRLDELATYASPVRPGFKAVPRVNGGGALVVGDGRRGGRVVFHVDAGGGLGPIRSVAASGPFDLDAFSGGGAVVRADNVSWIDDDGKVLTTEPWPARSTTTTGCLDGRPAHGDQPTTVPGRFVAIDALVDACVVAPPSPSRGSFSWFTSESKGADARAAFVLLPANVVSQRLPDDLTALPPPAEVLVTSPTEAAPSPCPPDMVAVNGFCIDRYESQLVDAATGIPLADGYAATPSMVGHVLKNWAFGRWETGDLHARATPLPPLMRAPSDSPLVAARGRAGVFPHGYTSGRVAVEACAGAGKRLCKHEEFVTACRGEQDRDFPYGDSYEQGACNVHRYQHPAKVLHGNASVGHLDPRLNRVQAADGPLLRRSGASPRCASRWGDDAVYDLVGNLDEWVDDKNGLFAGGFYSRSTRKGCKAAISFHPTRYLDYSLGTRCCLDMKR